MKMSILQQISKYFGLKFRRRRNALTPDFSSPIHRIPSEIIFHIVDYLPVESAASLSSTCHTFHTCLGERCLEPLKNAADSAKNQFLHLLQRDLPTSIACPHCIQLHSMSSAKKYHYSSQTGCGASETRLKCSWADLTSGLDRGIYHGFSSIIFHMVMKAHRESSYDTTQLLSLLSCGPRRNDSWGVVEQCTVDARIRDVSLLVREQTIYVVPRSQEVPLPWDHAFKICPHISFTKLSLYRYGIQIPHAYDIEGFENKQGFICCNYCYTEFRIDFKSYGVAGNAMFLTRWMDLGEGRDWNDHKFKSRVDKFMERTDTNVDFRRGSICAAFEQKPESTFKFDSLLSQKKQENLCKENIRPLPEHQKVSFVGQKQYDMVRHGRIVPRPVGRAQYHK